MLVQEVWKTLSIEGVVAGVSALLGVLVRYISYLLFLSCCLLVVCKCTSSEMLTVVTA